MKACSGPLRRQCARDRSPAMATIAPITLRLSAERPDGLLPRVENVEYAVHADQLKERAHLLGEAAELEIAAVGVQLAERGENRAQAGAIDESELAQIEDEPAVLLEDGSDLLFKIAAVAGIQALARNHDNSHVLLL